ncbi:hypothetical protein FEE96_15160 [Parasedimentitalea maritima]|uniref:Uncharacterized protein n=1 Tax=Parasedimentitalea maritima TaxID=2578117 RepID=A0ABY2UT73_9RHOB|nr:hypothetical protein [Zongyanglinia marina]TLP61573.1 hypothetical protein FEE96_15160 [Zongyanglinia marina]
MTEIRTLLNLDRWTDLNCSAGGFTALGRPDIAPRAVDISVNKPLDPTNLKELVKFARPVPRAPIEELFGLCNGVMVGRYVFNVFGVLDKTGGGGHAHIPLDTNVPNLYGRPEELDEELLILAKSTEITAPSGKSSNFFHFIDTFGKISVSDSENLLKPVRTFDDVTKWLCSEFERAVSGFEASG